MRAIALATGLLVLAACAGPQQPQPIDLSNPQQVINAARDLCQQGQPWIMAAAMVPEPRVQMAVGVASAVCMPLLAGGNVPSALNANTLTELASNLALLRKAVEK